MKKKYKKTIKITILNFCMTIALVVISILGTTSSLFTDTESNEKQISSATLDLEIKEFTISDEKLKKQDNWTPHDISVINFIVDNKGYDDINLKNELSIYWNDEDLKAGLILIYPATMSDSDIRSDIKNNGAGNCLYGNETSNIVTLDNGKKGLKYEVPASTLKGEQSTSNISEQSNTYSYKIVFNTVRYDLNYLYKKELNVNLATSGTYEHNSNVIWKASDSDAITFETIDEDRDPIEIITEVVDKRIDDHNSNPLEYLYPVKEEYVGDFVIVGEEELYDLEFVHFDKSKEFYVTYVEKSTGPSYTNNTVFDISGSEWTYTADGNNDPIPYNTLQDILYKRYAEANNQMNQFKTIMISRKNEVDLFQNQAFPDGAISKQKIFWEYLDSQIITNQVSPYFSNIAARLMLDNISNFDMIKKYINWYFNAILMTDTIYGDSYLAPGGAIYDFSYTCTSTTSYTKTIFNPNDPFDSVDSYAATFFSLLKEYVEKTGDTDIIINNAEKIEMIKTAMESVYDSNLNLTYAKPNYMLYLTLNNEEVCKGYKDLSWLYENVLNNNAKALDCKNKSIVLESSIEDSFLIQNGNFKFYKCELNELDSDAYYRVLFPEGGYYNLYGKYYPDTLVQIYSLLLGITEPTNELNNAVDKPMYIHNTTTYNGNYWFTFEHNDPNIFPHTESLVANLMLPSGIVVNGFDYDYQIELAMSNLLTLTRNRHYNSLGEYVSMWDVAETGYAHKAFSLYLQKHYTN